MTWVTEQLAIEGKFLGWTHCKIKYANTPFQEPTNAPYIALWILDGQAHEATIGGPAQRRHIGVVSVQIFDRENVGEQAIRSLADKVEALFINAGSRVTISATEYIDFDTPSLSGPQAIEGKMQRNVTIGYSRDEFR